MMYAALPSESFPRVRKKISFRNSSRGSARNSIDGRSTLDSLQVSTAFGSRLAVLVGGRRSTQVFADSVSHVTPGQASARSAPAGQENRTNRYEPLRASSGVRANTSMRVRFSGSVTPQSVLARVASLIVLLHSFATASLDARRWLAFYLQTVRIVRTVPSPGGDPGSRGRSPPRCLHPRSAARTVRVPRPRRFPAALP